PQETSVSTSFLYWAGAVAVLVVVALVLRRMRGSGGGLITLGKSRARILPENRTATFAQVGGANEAKKDLQDIIDFLRSPATWKSAGIRLPRGVLLEGPPGCGKTLLARAVAGEAKVPFFFVSASEFVEMFVGVGAARVRDTFETASKKAPAIIFIDELDAVGRRRGSGVGSAHDEREQTLNQLLSCMDGFETDDRVVVIAATNRPDILDQALVRPGRLDRRIRIPLPDAETRLAILRIHTAPMPLADDVSLQKLADRCEGVNGAMLENLANEAALLAVRRCRAQGEKISVAREDFEHALQKISKITDAFDSLDQVLVESATQLAKPSGPVVVEATLHDGTRVQGELVWVDGTFLKLKHNGESRIVAKRQIHTLTALSGTESVRELVADPWAAQPTDVA
ncbi:MAG TPA: AAA family ATPase, partial [Polyangiaceae bacterium]|nr:AAA family ATPase [Polyangiaceae bacterium]